ncbi:hypothetical protein K3888_13210 [Dietzia aurantiaca]|uniref:hypothetical protein n=1 Tax=Dietzia aurantiaca TaxID=983873 RepID=UPI001E44D80E|nr:hypothetical protein [Dietzia aurantiaca]MCD2263658.1 hypothetical protein [Dietzia aurantiaca]
MRTVSMLLPYTKPPLSLNDRGHHMDRARVVADVRRSVFLIARSHNLPTGLEHVTVQLHYRPRDNRRRDTDNLTATLKPACDALAAGTKKHPGYGLVPDDTPTYMAKPEPIIHPAEKGRAGQLWLDITWNGEPQ